MPMPPTIGARGIMFFGRPSSRPFVLWPVVSCPLTPIRRDAISLYLVEGFQWNLTQIFVICVGIAEKVFKVKSKVKVIVSHRLLIVIFVYIFARGRHRLCTVWRRGGLVYNVFASSAKHPRWWTYWTRKVQNAFLTTVWVSCSSPLSIPHIR